MNAGTTFQLKLTTLRFWTRYTENKHFWSKIKKVNSSIEFWVFKLVPQSITEYFETFG